MNLPSPLPRLYAICDVDLLRLRRLEPMAVVNAWLDAGVRLIQLRAKTLTMGPMLALADEVVELARASNATVIINDRADIARLCGAAGVHVGQDDLPPSMARRIVGDEAIVGLSTHDQHQVVRACREPVSYVAIGPVYETRTKAEADPVVGLAGVSAAATLAAAAGRPLVAIGGIDLARAPAVLEAGASAVAVASDLIGDNPSGRARAWMAAAAGWDRAV